jgi:hypothetical protein
MAKPKICDAPGCDRPTRKCMKYCSVHDQRLRRLGTFDLPARPRYTVDPESGCWNWLGYRNERGYGVETLPDDSSPHGYRSRYAHRAYYERAKGSIPRHLHLDHLCRNPSCVNPNHLEAVTPAENVQRGLAAKLTPETVTAMRLRHAEGDVTTLQLAKAYGIHHSQVSRVVRGLAWRDMEPCAGLMGPEPPAAA